MTRWLSPRVLSDARFRLCLSIVLPGCPRGKWLSPWLLPRLWSGPDHSTSSLGGCGLIHLQCFQWHLAYNKGSINNSSFPAKQSSRSTWQLGCDRGLTKVRSLPCLCVSWSRLPWGSQWAGGWGGPPLVSVLTPSLSHMPSWKQVSGAVSERKAS